MVLVQFFERCRHGISFGHAQRTACVMIAFAGLAAVLRRPSRTPRTLLAAVQQAAAPAPRWNYSPQRYRLLPPYTDPGFVRARSRRGQELPDPIGRVVAIDAGVWASTTPRQGVRSDQLGQREADFNKGWIVDTDDFGQRAPAPLHATSPSTPLDNGLNFYESFGYAFLGSLIWEQFAEIQPASLNDQVNTPFGGTMVGELPPPVPHDPRSGGYAPLPGDNFSPSSFNPVGGINRRCRRQVPGELASCRPHGWASSTSGWSLPDRARTDAPGSRNTTSVLASLSANITYGSRAPGSVAEPSRSTTSRCPRVLDDQRHHFDRHSTLLVRSPDRRADRSGRDEADCGTLHPHTTSSPRGVPGNRLRPWDRASP